MPNTSQGWTQAAPIPSLLYGTAWKEDRTEALTRLAVRAGFRGIDTANQRKHYFEAGVGAALNDALGSGEVSRSQLFLQSKFTFLGGQDERLPYDRAAAIETQVQQSFESSLVHLGTDYLDSYVLHGPSSRHGLTAKDFQAWRAMEALAQDGRVRWLGVSNVSLEQLAALYAAAKVPPKFVQNRCYAQTRWDSAVRALCRTHDSVYQGFSLLTANRNELASPAARGIAERVGRPIAQVVFRFCQMVGILPLTGTSRLEHMRLDLEANALDLSASEVSALETLSAK
jgi:diketogulonate reductase-like aldo/keto reductase